MVRKDSHHTQAIQIPQTISKEEIARLPLVQYTGEIQLVRTQKELKQAVKELKKETVLGFDTESKPSFNKGTMHSIAVVQLAGAEVVYLIQVKLLKDINLLNEIWRNPKILKVGIALSDDVKKLKELADFTAKGFLDISSLTKKVGISNTGLRALAGIFLKKRISKSAQVSNWAKEELSPQQIYYAATDAWISRELYMQVIELPQFQEAQHEAPRGFSAVSGIKKIAKHLSSLI